MSLHHYLFLSAIIFCIGLFGVLSRKTAIGLLMSVELMFNAANINIVASSSYLTKGAIPGQVFTIFIIVLAAAETTIGLAIILSIFRFFKDTDLQKMDSLKG